MKKRINVQIGWLLVLIQFINTTSYAFEDIELALKIPYTTPTKEYSKEVEGNFGGVIFSGALTYSKYVGIIASIGAYDLGYVKKDFERNGKWTTNHNVFIATADLDWTLVNLISNNIWINPYIGSGVGVLKTNGDKNDENIPSASMGVTAIPNIGINFLLRKYSPLFFLFPISGTAANFEIKYPIYSDSGKFRSGVLVVIGIGVGFGSCRKCDIEEYEKRKKQLEKRQQYRMNNTI